MIKGTISDNETDSGLMIFKIIDGQFMHKDCYVEVLMDDMLYPAYVTTRLKTKNVKIDESKSALNWGVFFFSLLTFCSW